MSMQIFNELRTPALMLVCAASLLVGIHVGHDQGLSEGQSQGLVYASVQSAKQNASYYAFGFNLGAKQQIASDGTWAIAIHQCQERGQTMFGNGPMSCWAQLQDFNLAKQIVSSAK